MGVVQSITGNTITVTTPDNQTKTVDVTAATTYKTADNQSAALSDIKVGDQLMAVGTLNGDGSSPPPRCSSARRAPTTTRPPRAAMLARAAAAGRVAGVPAGSRAATAAGAGAAEAASPQNFLLPAAL